MITDDFIDVNEILIIEISVKGYVNIWLSG